MNRPTRPVLPVMLDRERHLVIDFNALASFEEVTGKNALAVDLWTALSARDLRALLWAALIHEDRNLTLEDVGAMLDPANSPDIINALSDAYVAAMPKPKEGEPPLTESPSQ